MSLLVEPLPKSLPQPLLRKLVQSPHLDIFGSLLILGICLYLNFHQTIYFQGKAQFNIPTQELMNYFRQGAFPLGFFSIIGAIFSILATRFVGKQKNLGNFIAILTAVSSGIIDYLFGNHSAIITYPITFLIHSYALKRWSQGEKIRKRDVYYYLITAIGLIFGFLLVYLGAYLFGGRIDHKFLSVVSLTFGLSLGANFCNALKYEETWLSWIVYNSIQITKALMQLNIANVVKYIFYLVNAFITLFDWKLNGDLKK